MEYHVIVRNKSKIIKYLVIIPKRKIQKIISRNSLLKVKNNEISLIHFEEGKTLKWVSRNKSQKAKVINQNYQLSANLSKEKNYNSLLSLVSTSVLCNLLNFAFLRSECLETYFRATGTCRDVGVGPPNFFIYLH